MIFFTYSQKIKSRVGKGAFRLTLFSLPTRKSDMIDLSQEAAI